MKTVKTGIRLKPNGKYHATKCFKGKRYYAEFEKEKDAVKWRKEFHPFAPKTKFTLPSACNVSNGFNKDVTFGEVVANYRDYFLISLSEDTRNRKVYRLEKFCRDLEECPMHVMTPEIISNHVLASKSKAIRESSKRCNFEKELKDISSVFNWYKLTKDFTFNNPVNKTHYKLGVIKPITPPKKYLSSDEVLEFLDHLPPMYHSMAKIMYLLALRVGEVAGFTDDSVDFKRKQINLYYVLTWIKGRPVIKRGDKTETDAILPISDVIEDALLELRASRPKGCRYFFHLKGKPLRHAQILKVFNKALVDADLPYSGTHIMRYSMATEVRRTRGLDASQAILRHKSARMSEHYANLDVNEKASSVIIEASDLFKQREKLRLIASKQA